VRVEFSVLASSAVARGLRTPTQWQDWAAQPWAPVGALELDVSHIPAMARRRLGPLAKMAVVVADDVLAQAALADIPMVWVSRYGDSEKSLQLLRDQVGGQALSPTAFALSVHNGIAAQYSILRGMVSNAICVAASAAGPEAGIVEAIGLLHDGAPAVVLVCYDEGLPGEYATLSGAAAAAEFAWAVVVTLAAPDLPGYALTATACGSGVGAGGADLPYGLQVLRFLLDPVHTHWMSPPAAVGRPGWRWERLHG